MQKPEGEENGDSQNFDARRWRRTPHIPFLFECQAPRHYHVHFEPSPLAPGTDRT